MQLYCQLGTLTPNQFVEGAIQDLLENPDAANAINVTPGTPSKDKGK
jgi:hypothetical protein